MDFNNGIFHCGAPLLLLLVTSVNAMTHECISGKYQNPVVWVFPGDPVVLKSPDNFQVKPSQSLSCIWEVRALWGSKLAMQVDEKNVNYLCNDNQLTATSLSKIKNTFSYKTACGADKFPSKLETILDSGPILVSFQSNSNDGSVEFSLTFLSVSPPSLDSNWGNKSSCSSGPCCQGDDCCIYNVEEAIQNPSTKPQGFPFSQLWAGVLEGAMAQPKVDCLVKLRAPPGFQVSVNFKEMEVMEDANGGCTQDFVKIYEDVEPTTFSLIGKKGLRFCGQHLPNSPAPSVFASSGNELYIRYKTDERITKRGKGFKLVATAINPLVTAAQFTHKYGDKTCKDRCDAIIPPTSPPTTSTMKPECKNQENLVYITNTTAPHKYVAGAEVTFRIETTEKIVEFTKTTNNEGLIDFSNDLATEPRIEGGKRYAVNIETNDFIERTVNIYLNCEKTKLGRDCPSCYFEEPLNNNNYTECGDKKFITPENMQICDCTENKCNKDVLQTNEECKPCIDIPLKEKTPTTPSPYSSTVMPCPQINDRKIKITVKDKATKDPIKNAYVMFTHDHSGAVGTDFTNSQGHVNYGVDVNGKYTVNIKMNDYENSTVTATVDCTMEKGCKCSVEVEAKIKRIDKCKDGMKIEIRVRFQYGDLEKDQYAYVGGYNHNSHLTQVEVNSHHHKNIAGVVMKHKIPKSIIYDVTGMVPDDFTFKIWNVHKPFQYETLETTRRFDLCPSDETWTNISCCKKEYLFTVRPERAVTEITEDVTQPHTTTVYCPYPRQDLLHIKICGDTWYTAYGDPRITLFSVDYNIVEYVAVGTIKSTDVVDGSLKCTGEYSDKTLIKGYYPKLQNTDMSNDTVEVHINGTNFQRTQKLLVMDCVEGGCENCTREIQILIKPKICDKEFFTVTVVEATTNEKIPGAKVEFFKVSDGTLYTENPTDKDGLAKIKIDRSIQQLKLRISKEGYISANEEQDINCKVKACGECSPTLRIIVHPEPPCEKKMFINVTATDESGNPIIKAEVIMILQKSIARASQRIVKKEDTDESGKVTIEVPMNGTYQIQIKSANYIDKSKEIVIENCETQNVSFTMTLAECKTPPCKSCNTEITFNIHDISISSITAPLKNAKITVYYIKHEEQVVVPSDVAVNLKTDTEGVLRIPTSNNGNYSYSLTLEDYLKDPTTGFIVVDCDPDAEPDGCKSCKPTVNITLKRTHCNQTKYGHNFCVKVTDYEDHLEMPGAQVIVTLTNFGANKITKEIGRNITSNSGILCFWMPEDGDYFVGVERTNYDKNITKVDWKCDPQECQTCNKTIVIPIKKEFCQDIELKVVVKNSTSNKPVKGAVITVSMDGMENGVKKHIERQKINDSGIILIPLDMNGNYTFIIEAEGYITYTGEHKVNIDLTECETYMPMKSVPMVSNDICENGVRISLSWGINPTDLDLYTFRMMYEDSSQYCQTYFCDQKSQCGCTTFDTENLYKGDHGAETITICCRDLYSYMLYVDERSEQGKLFADSEAKITLTSNIKDKKVTLARPAPGAPDYKRYWIAGCLTTGMGNFKYIPVNQFRDIQPSTSEPLLCHNLVTTEREQEKRGNFPDNVELSVSAIDMATHKEVDGVLIKLAAPENDKIVQQEKVTSSSQDRDSKDITFKIGENGEYTISAEKKGYTSTNVNIKMNCNKTSCFIQPITVYLLKTLPTGDIRISLTYQENTKYFLNLFQVNKENIQDACNALDSYDATTEKLACNKIELEWTSNDQFQKYRNGNGDSFILKDASSNSKYTYIIYVKDIVYPDKYTYLTLSDSKHNKVIKAVSPNEPLVKGFWFVGCLAVEGTSFNFIEKNRWSTKNPSVDGSLICHQEFTDPTRPAIWKVPTEYCEGTTLQVVAKDINGTIIPNATSVIKAVLDDGTTNQLKGNNLIGNGVYTTKVEADGYTTDNVEKSIKCNMEDCNNCKPSTEIIMAKKTEAASSAILSVTSQNGAKLSFVIYKGQDVTMNKNAEGNVISIPVNQNDTEINIAVVQDIGETGKISDTDAVFTLRYEGSVTKLKIPSDAYHNEKYWLIGFLKMSPLGDKMEFFSDNFYANELTIFGSVKRTIGLTLP